MNVFQGGFIFLQSVDPTSSVFGINPTTVYGVFVGVLFLALLFVGNLFMKNQEKLLAKSNAQVDRLQVELDKAHSENDKLHVQIYEMGIGNVRVLEKFSSGFETFVNRHEENNTKLLGEMKELSLNIKSNLEFNRSVIVGISNQK